jgi:hypothetical protein
MTMCGKLLVFAAAAVITLTASGAHARACSNGVCAESTDDGRTMNAYLSTQFTGMTHYNIRYGGEQFESNGRVSFSVQQGRTYKYSIQACRRGGFAQASTCTKWANFVHEVDEPKGSVSQGLETPASKPGKILGKKSPANSTPKQATCESGLVWRERFDGDAVCVRPDDRYRLSDGRCRSGYVWRDRADDDKVCVTPAQRAAAKRQ